MPHVIADDARLSERGFAGDMRAVRGMSCHLSGLWGRSARRYGAAHTNCHPKVKPPGPIPESRSSVRRAEKRILAPQAACPSGTDGPTGSDGGVRVWSQGQRLAKPTNSRGNMG